MSFFNFILPLPPRSLPPDVHALVFGTRVVRHESRRVAQRDQEKKIDEWTGKRKEGGGEGMSVNVNASINVYATFVAR